jgi:uncharacterized protein (TIGR00255 family)
MKSMTGHGRGDRSHGGFKIAVELSSVNRKQGEIALTLPRELEILEPRLREEINRRVARGRLTARVVMQAAGTAVSAGRTVDEALAGAYLRDFRALAAKLGLPPEVSLDLLLRAPGVLHAPGDLADPEEYWPALEKAVQTALDALVKMREREGAHLERDLKARVKTARQAATRIAKAAPRVAERYRRQLLERVKAAGVPVAGVEDERLLKETVYFADRCDITEELTRLTSHFQQFDDCLKSTGPVGRTLDFLAQEMNREVNTIGSKANDAAIARDVVVLKSELERFREQALNVE